MESQDMDIVKSLDEIGVYAWVKPMLIGAAPYWSAHVETRDKHRNIGCFESREAAMAEAVSAAEAIASQSAAGGENQAKEKEE